jgi:hypothetical protein
LGGLAAEAQGKPRRRFGDTVTKRDCALPKLGKRRLCYSQ